MKRNIILSVIFGVLTTSLMSLFFSSCSKDEPTLNAPIPSGSFTYSFLTPTSYTASQNLQLVSSGKDAMMAYWFIPGVGNYTGDTVRLTIPFAGSYNVKLLLGGPGGVSDTIRQTVTIDKDNPYGIDPNGILSILSGAGLGLTQRTWMANPVTNACVVAPDMASALSGSGVWWGYGNAEINPVTGRVGYMDDTYTFTFGQTGSFIYDDKSTTYLDNGGSNWTKALPAPWNTFGGTTSSTDLYNIVPALKPWGSGNFTYSITAAPAGYSKLGQITVNGVGAHFGLQDKNNGGEVATPAGITSIKYDVLKIDMNQTDATTGKHYDAIFIGLTYNSSGNAWAFKFRSDR